MRIIRTKVGRGKKSDMTMTASVVHRSRQYPLSMAVGEGCDRVGNVPGDALTVNQI